MLSVLVGKPGSSLEDIQTASPLIYFKFILVHWWLAFIASFVQYFSVNNMKVQARTVLCSIKQMCHHHHIAIPEYD